MLLLFILIAVNSQPGFQTGTMIWMADGSCKPIENVVRGDLIMTELSDRILSNETVIGLDQTLNPYFILTIKTWKWTITSGKDQKFYVWDDETSEAKCLAGGSFRIPYGITYIYSIETIQFPLTNLYYLFVNNTNNYFVSSELKCSENYDSLFLVNN